ncbi:MAG TPA: hypothetical protein VH724_17345 [Candidatus Angelobacter sp.]|nr:hypothetical protein [Candidatus Angelobacter sp.]
MQKTLLGAIPLRALLCFIFAVCMFGTSYGQTANDAMPAMSPGYVRMPSLPINSTTAQPVSSAPTLVFPDGADTSKGSFSSDLNTAGSGNSGLQNSARGNSATRTRISEVGGVIPGLDTVPTFAGAFAGQAGPSTGVVFPFIFVGNDPRAGGTTRIPAKITAVSLRLLNPDGSLRATIPFAPFEDLTEDSPNFEESNFTSGRHIQYGDAVLRAQFFNNMDEDWHTVLTGPTFVNRVTFNIPRFVNVRFPDGSIKAVQAYFVGQARNGDLFIELLDLLFNALNTNQVINDINAGNFTTDAFNINMYPNTFLFSINNQGQFAGCCVLGFHTYFLDSSATPQPRWIFNFASWISPGLFGAGFQDVTALSHEIAETFADPFVNTRTPNWQFPGVAPTAKVCQSNLEEGDPIEVLPNATIPIFLRERREVFTYHPQIIPLLQWFEMGKTSDAIGGAFSYPDTTTLPHSALPCPQ